MNSEEDFISIMTHELRGPIDGIKKISEAIRDNRINNDSRKHAEYMQMIYTNSSFALELINNLLDMTKIESKTLDLCIRPTEIKKTINECVSFFDVDSEITGVRIDVSFGKNIPEKIEFDPIYIKQVLRNLISNALKFTATDGCVTVSVFVHKKGELFSKEIKDEGVKWFDGKKMDDKFNKLQDCVVVSVTDSGPGVPEDDIVKLFAKFTQLDNEGPRETKKGLGLGLAVAKGVVEKHNGVMGASSRVEEGSVFYFTINI